MPVLSPEFEAPMGPAQGTLEAENLGQSWVTQAAQRAQIAAQTGQIGAQTGLIQANTAEAQQNTSQQAQAFQAALPAVIAKNQADQLAAQNDIASATLQQNLRGQWQALKPQVVQDIGDITDPNNIPKEADGTPDWTAIYNKYENLQAKYSSLALLPEGKQYYDMIEQGKKDSFEMAAKHAQAQILLNQLKVQSQLNLNNREAVIDKTAATNAATKPAIAQTEAGNTMRNQAFTDISTQRDNLGQMGFAISNLGQDLSKEQASPVAGTAARFLGPGIVGKVSAPVQQVEQDIGDFANRIMATVKNIRNVNEFRAVTASIPHADDQPSVQNEKLQKLQTINQVLGQRNDYKEQALRSDPSLAPDQADQQATQRFPFPSSIIGPVVKETPPASMSTADSEALEWAKANPKDPRSAAILQHLSTLQ
jgi:hypothetical protein